MKTILITGGCGFIGSNFINYYFDNYTTDNIICFDAMYYCASKQNIKSDIFNSNRFTMIEGNLCNFTLLKTILLSYNVTHVIHFAAQSHVDNSFHNSFQYTMDNVVGTHNLLEAIKEINKNIFLLHFSTDEVYGDTISDNIKNEQSILCPTNPYSASKAAAEMYVLSYIYSFKLKGIITRGNNVYGENQYPEKLIPHFIDLLKRGMKCTIAGTGNQLRNFIHVYDVCTAVDCIIKYGKIGEIYNIGSDAKNEFSVIEVARKLIAMINNDTNYSKYIEYIPDRPFNDTRYFISNDKLTKLGWTQTIDFDTGLRQLLSK